MIVNLLEDHEMRNVGVRAMPKECRKLGIKLIRFPIRDLGVPEDIDVLKELLFFIADLIDDGERVVIHCMGGLGRSGLFAGCLLRAFGCDFGCAMFALRRARGPRCPETNAQRAYVRDFLLG